VEPGPAAADLLGGIARAARLLSRRDEAARAARRERDRAIHEAACWGLSLAEIAEAAGITKQAAHQVVQAAGGSRQTPPSRAAG
jgi:hypothetical protein